ncbi:MAG: YihY/virulence factor BrkB family protein [Acidobacteriota bacterium]
METGLEAPEVHPRPRVSRLASLFWSLVASVRYIMQTEVHVYAFSIAANVLLSFFPFLIVCMSLGRLFNQDMTGTLKLAMSDVFPDALGIFMNRNLPSPQKVEVLSLCILLFSANGIFEPLEVALNRVWGIEKNRSFLRNQIVSLGLVFVCGSLALLSLAITAMRANTVTHFAVERWVSALFYKSAAIPVTVLILFLIYRYLPNGRPPVQRVFPAAIGVGVLLEVLKSMNVWLWPTFETKLEREYGVFHNSATLIFLSFLTSMLVLAGAEWAARGHKLGPGRRDGQPEHHR